MLTDEEEEGVPEGEHELEENLDRDHEGRLGRARLADEATAEEALDSVARAATPHHIAAERVDRVRLALALGRDEHGERLVLLVAVAAGLTKDVGEGDGGVVEAEVARLLGRVGALELFLRRGRGRRAGGWMR